MSKEDTLQEIINQLNEENIKLKLQLKELNNSTNTNKPQNNNNVIINSLYEQYSTDKIGYWNYSIQDKTFTCSPEIKQLLEIPIDDDFSNFDHLKSIIHPSEYVKFKKFNQNLFSNPFNIEETFHTILNDGSSRYIKLTANAKKDDSGEISKIFGTATDVTDSHFKLEKLQQNENLFRSLFNNLTDIFIIFELVKDIEGNVIDYIYKDINYAFEMKFNLSKSEIINRNLSIQSQLYQQFHPILKITAQTEQAQQDRFYIQSLDSFHDVLIYKPTLNNIATIWRDVTLMVKTESSLRENEEKYRQIFSLGSDGLFMIDLFTSKILEVNPSACNMIGTSKDELLGLNFKQLFNEPELFEKKIKTNKSDNITGYFIQKNGKLLPVEGSLSYFNWGGHKVVIISVRDISIRTAAQKELVNSEKRFKQLFDYSNDAILILDEHKIIDCNNKATQLFVANNNKLIDNTLWNISPSQQSNGEDSRLLIVEKTQEVLQGKKLHFNWQFKNSKNIIFYADVKLSPIFIEDQKVIQVIVRDITPKKLLEDELIKKENRWKHSLEVSSIGIWDWNLITNEVYFSTEWKKLIGYEKKEIQNKFEEFENRVHPDDIAYVYNQIEAYISNKTTTFNINFRLRSKNGSYKWINSNGKIFSYTSEGKAERFIGTHADITKFIVEQQKAQSTIHHYIDASNTLKMGYWELNLRNMLFNGTKESFSIFGLNTTQATLKQIEDQIYPEDQSIFISQFINNKANDIDSQIFRIIVNTEIKYIISFSKPIFDSKKRIEGYSGVFQDITLFKKQELQIKDDQALINSYIEKNQQAVLIVQDQDILYLNEKFTQLTGFDINSLIKNKIPFIELVTNEDKTKLLTVFENITLNNTTHENVSVRIETKHKRIKWVKVLITLIKFKGRNANLFVMNDITNEKANEIKLKTSLIEYQEISSNSPLGIAKFDLNEILTYINIEFSNLLDIHENQINKITLKQIFSETDYYYIHNAIEDIKEGSINVYQNELFIKNHLWIQLKITPLIINEKISNFILYIDNIDIIKKQIDLLTEDNFLYNSMLENSSAGIGIFNNKGDLIVHNKAYLENLNYNNDNKTTVKFTDFYIHKNNEPIKLEDSLNSKQHITFEHSINSNKTIFFEVKSIDLLTSKAVMMVTKDITDAKKQGTELISQLQKFNTIFNQSPTGTALIDSNRNIVICNKKYAQIFGYSSTELTKMKLDQLIKTENLPELITKFSELFSGVTKSFSQLNKVSLREKESIWVRSTLSQFTDNFNEVSYVIQVIEDVTESIEDEYNSVNIERLKTLNYIANNFAHVFNNLLMSIYGNSYLIRTNIDDEKINTYASNLIDSLKSASEHTHKLLSFAKKSSKINLKINIPELIDQIIDEIKLKANIQIKTSFDHKIENTLGDPSQLQRVFHILFQNANEAMPNGGIINIETKSVYFDDITSQNLSEPGKGKYIRIRVSDNGTGIHPDVRDKIFDPFFTTKKENVNAGLGLTIVQKIISEHKGTIKVKSQLNKGSDFMIYLPQYDNDYIKNSVQPDEQLIVKGTANLIIIDDEDIVRIVTAELLKKLGYNVFSFSSGKKAIQFYKENTQNIDLVVLDKHMPEMDGTEVYKYLKNINPNIHVILLTGFNIDKEIENVFNNAQNCIVQKPVSIEKLSNAISTLLIKK